MRRIAVIIITAMLVAIIGLQVLAALNIFPHQQRVPVCPVDAISMQGGKAKIDPKKCIGCRRCVAGVSLPAELVQDTLLFTQTATPSEKKNEALPAVVKPSAKADKAGEKPRTKATEDKKILYRVTPEKCVGCGLCTIYCPEGAIKMVGDKAVIDSDKCINCGLCKNGNSKDFKGCPFNAITGP